MNHRISAISYEIADIPNRFLWMSFAIVSSLQTNMYPPSGSSRGGASMPFRSEWKSCHAFLVLAIMHEMLPPWWLATNYASANHCSTDVPPQAAPNIRYLWIITQWGVVTILCTCDYMITSKFEESTKSWIAAELSLLLSAPTSDTAIHKEAEHEQSSLSSHCDEAISAIPCCGGDSPKRNCKDRLWKEKDDVRPPEKRNV